MHLGSKRSLTCLIGVICGRKLDLSGPRLRHLGNGQPKRLNHFLEGHVANSWIAVSNFRDGHHSYTCPFRHTFIRQAARTHGGIDKIGSIRRIGAHSFLLAAIVRE